jgi:hypothetical protein
MQVEVNNHCRVVAIPVKGHIHSRNQFSHTFVQIKYHRRERTLKPDRFEVFEERILTRKNTIFK